MKTDRNKKLGRESLDRAKALLAMSDKDRPWKPFEFVADDCFRDKSKKTFSELIAAVEAKIVIRYAITKMIGE